MYSIDFWLVHNTEGARRTDFLLTQSIDTKQKKPKSKTKYNNLLADFKNKAYTTKVSFSDYIESVRKIFLLAILQFKKKIKKERATLNKLHKNLVTFDIFL